MTKYNQETESQMLTFYSQLKERQKRLYASIEAKKVGYGGELYIGNLLGISQKTIRKADNELKNPDLLAQGQAWKTKASGGWQEFFLSSHLICYLF
jgi:hypothetical protein